MTKKGVIVFHKYGPYHYARVNGILNFIDITPIELSSTSEVYAWNGSNDSISAKVYTLFKKKDSRKVPLKELKDKIIKVFNEINPDFVLVNGWSDSAAIIILQWCLQNKIQSIVMSESTSHDFKRVKWKEIIKKYLVKKYCGAVVGGSLHIKYLTQLGISSKNITTCYDVIDNNYFSNRCIEIKANRYEYAKKYKLPRKYMFASGRFVEKKNFLRLIEAYAIYQKQVVSPFYLVIAGDGNRRKEIQQMINDNNINHLVYLLGFRQIDEIPVFYCLADFFIHASTTEQWGLVVNEAMACSLPILVSKKCGCAIDLVKENVNGYTFDPYDVEEMSYLMKKMHHLDLAKFGRESKTIIENLTPQKFGSNIVSLLPNIPTFRRYNFLDKIIFSILIRFYKTRKEH